MILMQVFYKYENNRLTEQQLRRTFPHISFPSIINADELPAGVTQIEIPDPEPVVPTLDELKNIKAQEIRTHSDILIAQVSQGYSQGEVSTFAQQYQGAKDIQAGSTTTEEAQFVVSLLTARLGATPTNEQITAFAALIVSNFEAAKAATVQIIGTQQRLELAVRACTTADEVAAITWPAS